MKFGLRPLQAGGDFEETIRECERAEAAGFDSIWLGEHHNNGTLYPAPLLGLAANSPRERGEFVSARPFSCSRSTIPWPSQRRRRWWT
jgi:hypothetical protein